MAESGDHDELRGSIAGQSFYLATKDIVTVLLLVAFVTVVYLVWRATDARFDLMQSHHIKLFDILGANRESTREEINTVLRHIAVVNWNCTHPDEQHIPLGFNGAPSGARPPP